MAGLAQDSSEAQHIAEPGTQEEYPFRFVEVGRPSQPRDEDRRSAIRSHVMRDFYEKRSKIRRPSTQPEINSAASEKEGASQQISRFKISAQGLQEVKKRRNKRGKDLQPIGTSPGEPCGPPKTRKTQASRRNPKLIRPVQPVQPIQPNKRVIHLPSDNRDSREEDASANNEPTATTSTTSSNSKVRLRFDPPSRATLGSGKPEYLPPGSSTIDPFDTLPLCGQRTQILLYHAHRTILSARIMGQIRTDWLSMATSDVALYYLALSHYAGNYGLSKQENDPVEAVRFRSEAIKIVNEKLGDMSAALTDATISTVACLSSYEATHGTPADIKTHLEGLQRLVSLKGGLRFIENPSARRLILWTDLNCANALGTDPIFSEYDTREHLEPKASTLEVSPPDPPSSSVPAYHTPTEIELLSQELKDNFTSLKELALFDTDIGRGTKPKRLDAIQYSDKLYVTERSLLTLANRCGPHKFVTCGCLAAIIYLDNHFRGIGFKAAIMSSLLSRLRNSMASVLDHASTSRRNRDDNITRAILWVLFVGGLASEERSERAWFADQILLSLRNFSANLWEDIEVVLKGFLWPPEWEHGGYVLWAEIQEKLLFQSTLYTNTEAQIQVDGENKGKEVEFSASN